MTTATAQAGPLHSDHINYLILRYLQEAGHEASATAFYRDWRRSAEFRDPEDLPFAPTVQRHELVSVIQDGLYHDELVSRVRNQGRKFHFTTNGAAAGSRPGTAGKGKGRVGELRREPEEFPTPPPKRQRTSDEGRHGPNTQVNGATEPMEVDAASPSAGDAEEDAEGSPAVQTPEPEVVEVPERYDSMDVAVQTDGKTGPRTSTMSWRIDKADATILHSAFSLAKGSQTLFTAGEGLSRFYDVPSSFDQGVDKIPSLEDLSAPANSVITACAWHPDGQTLASAVDYVRDIGIGGKQERRQMVRSHNAQSSKTTTYHSPPLLEPSGLVLALRYSPDGSQLMAVRTNGSRGMVEVWDSAPSDNHNISTDVELRAWKMFEGRTLDAAWTAPNELVVVGDSLLERLRVTATERDHPGAEKDYSVKNVRLCGLEVVVGVVQPVLPKDASDLSFDKIRVSTATPGRPTYLAAVSSESNILVHGQLDEEDNTLLSPGEECRATALAFRPSSMDDEEVDSLDVLAVALQDGSCMVRRLNAMDGGKHLIHMADWSSALALAWSPDGSHLAVFGTDIVQIWQTRPGHDPQATVVFPEPVVTWRRDRSVPSKALRNGEHATNGTLDGESEEPLPEPSLSWSADGDSLALAVGKEIAVIRFTPPLRKTRQDGANGVNGHGS